MSKEMYDISRNRERNIKLAINQLIAMPIIDTTKHINKENNVLPGPSAVSNLQNIV